MDNHQCRFLSDFDPTDFSISPAKHLESAKYNLQHHFFFVGITEDLDSTLPSLFKALSLSEPQQVPRLNTSEKQYQYPRELIQKLQERNWADIELYAFAKKLFSKKMKSLKKKKHMK